jgi:hypothetical protein
MNSEDKSLTIIVCSLIALVLLTMGGCAHYEHAEKVEAFRNGYEQTMEPSSFQKVWKKK